MIVYSIVIGWMIADRVSGDYPSSKGMIKAFLRAGAIVIVAEIQQQLFPL